MDLSLSQNLPSDLEAIPEFILSVIEKIRQLPFSNGQLYDIKLSLEEALVNAVKHGNKFKPDLCIRVSVEAGDDSLAITVADQGEGFDFQDIPDPTKPANLKKFSGRGIFLIRNHMDKVEFFDGGRKIKMVKILPKGGKK